MLLAWKASFFPAKYSSVSLFVLKSNSRLLQKNWKIEKKSVKSERKVITCSWSIKMCITKLWAS